MTTPEHKWDAFISYASEDRAEVAFLVEFLTCFDLRIWFDQTELRVGDSLRERIDDGLSKCQYGIVFLSPHFFKKHYPERELSGLAQREVNGSKVILPVWKDLTDEDVRKYSPPLADRIAARWDHGEMTVIFRLLDVLRPEMDVMRAVKESAKRIVELPLVTSGEQLMAVIRGAQANQFVHDEFATKEEAEQIGDFLQDLSDLGEIIAHLEQIEFAREEFRLTQAIADLATAGWKVFAGKNRCTVGQGKDQTSVLASAFAVVRAERVGAKVFNDSFLIQKQ